jgi:hypothetical protein
MAAPAQVASLNPALVMFAFFAQSAYDERITGKLYPYEDNFLLGHYAM